MKYRVFDVNKPLLSDDTEVEVEANSPIEAVRKLYPSYNVKPYKYGSIVVSYPTMRGVCKKVYGFFK